MQSHLLLWSALNILTYKRYTALTEVYGSLESALQHIDEHMLKTLGCREDTIINTINRVEEMDMSAYVSSMEKQDIQLLCIEDEHYPKALKNIGDPPVFLYYKGDLTLLDQPCIGLVGTRKMSAYGRRATQDFTSACCNARLTTVSGLANGVDTAVAIETIKSNAKTVAVLGHGLSVIDPKEKRDLAQSIVDNGGLLLSEYPLDCHATLYNFPARNRIIAGLSIATVVLEAPEKSGACITADLALEYGREVYAVPGQIYDTNYDGCHRLLAENKAKLALSPEYLLKDLGVVVSESQSTEPELNDADQKAVFSLLTSMPQSVTDLVERHSAIDAAKANATLTLLELSGHAKKVGVGWVRT